MANTVVGIFANELDAQQAQNYLLENGFADGDIDIKIASYKSGTSADVPADSRDVPEEDDFFTKIGTFFRDLFGQDEQEAKLYSEAGKRGTIVTVHALNATEANTAADILDQFGAIDVKENAAKNPGRQIFTDGAYSGEVIPNEVRGTNDLDVNTVEPYTRNSPADPLPTSQQYERSDNEASVSPVVRSRSRIFERSLQDHLRLREQTLSNKEMPLSASSQDPDLQTYRDIDQTLSDAAQPTNSGDLTQRTDPHELTDQERLRRLNLEP